MVKEMSEKKPEKIILDATAGYRMMWFNKQHPNCLYIDQRSEVNPDEIQDFRKLPYPNNCFKLVVFDPPHEIKSDKSIKGWVMLKNFGRLKPETWSFDISKGLKECWRVLEPYGILIFKWNETDKKISQIQQYFPCKPLFGQKTNTSIARHGYSAHTFWFCFMKIP